MANHIMTNAIHDQIAAFKEGFWEVVPKHLVSIFNEGELELLVSGLPEIDVADLRANTEYAGYSASSQVIHWFWEVVREMDREDLARLVQFVTGTSKVSGCPTPPSPLPSLLPSRDPCLRLKDRLPPSALPFTELRHPSSPSPFSLRHPSLPRSVPAGAPRGLQGAAGR